MKQMIVCMTFICKGLIRILVSFQDEFQLILCNWFWYLLQKEISHYRVQLLLTNSWAWIHQQKNIYMGMADWVHSIMSMSQHGYSNNFGWSTGQFNAFLFCILLITLWKWIFGYVRIINNFLQKIGMKLPLWFFRWCFEETWGKRSCHTLCNWSEVFPLTLIPISSLFWNILFLQVPYCSWTVI